MCRKSIGSLMISILHCFKVETHEGLNSDLGSEEIYCGMTYLLWIVTELSQGKWNKGREKNWKRNMTRGISGWNCG